MFFRFYERRRYTQCVSSVIVVLNHFANLVRVAKLDGISQFVMAYGGLRGAIAFSLAVVLDRDHFQSRQLFITTTIVVVYFTNIVLVGNWCSKKCMIQRLYWKPGRKKPVVKVRGNAGERRSWAPKNCWRAFPGPTQPLMVQAG